MFCVAVVNVKNLLDSIPKVQVHTQPHSPMLLSFCYYISLLNDLCPKWCVFVRVCVFFKSMNYLLHQVNDARRTN